MILAAAIIPKFQLTDMQYNAISSVHNSMVDHFGLARTMKRLKANQHKWEFMENYLRYFIDFCPQCHFFMIKIPIHVSFYDFFVLPYGMFKHRLCRSIS